MTGLKVVYHCFGGAHASPTAAALHLGILAMNRRPSAAEFYRLIPYFDRNTRGEHGKIISIGNDHLGNEVCIMARRGSPQPVINAIREFSRLNGMDPEQYFFVDCSQPYNLLMVAGGFSSRGLGWVIPGRPLVCFGTRVAFPAIVKVVQRAICNLEGKQS